MNTKAESLPNERKAEPSLHGDFTSGKNLA